MPGLIDKAQAVGLVRRFIDSELPKESWYQEIKDHLMAVVLYGSVAKGTDRPDSDIDILLFMPIKIEEKHTAGEYFYSFEGREVNIVIRSIEGLRKIAKDGNDPFQREVFRDSEIVWEDLTGEVSNLILSVRDNIPMSWPK